MKFRPWLVGSVMFAALTGCVNDDGEITQVREAEQLEQQQKSWNPMLRNYADNVIIPVYQQASQSSEELASETGPLASYCELLGSEQEAAALQQAQQMWREAMADWQRVELYQLGPLAENGNALRDRIYSFGSNATLNECAVDQSVVLAQDAGFDISSRSYSSRGLAALEYLLFDDELNHACAAEVTATQNWNELPQATRKAQRCNYARAVAADINRATNLLVQAWQEDGGNYRFEFLHPSYTEQNLKALSDAMFYIETYTKDLKLGVPTGIHATCRRLECRAAAESRYSENALANIRNNLLEFQNMLRGGDGLGFDDAIIEAGFPEVVGSFVADAELGIAIIDNSQTSLQQQLRALEQSGDRSACDNAAANPEVEGGIAVCRLHGALKRITDRLRTDFVTIVNLDLPDRAQSDND